MSGAMLTTRLSQASSGEVCMGGASPIWNSLRERVLIQ